MRIGIYKSTLTELEEAPEERLWPARRCRRSILAHRWAIRQGISPGVMFLPQM